MVQPYKQWRVAQIKTVMQSIIIAMPDDNVPVIKSKQVNGAPPNFVHSIDGAWTMTAHSGGTRIGWAWTFHPKASPARLTTSVMGRMWMGYADRALTQLDALLTRD